MEMMHKDLAQGSWGKLSLAEQMANIGTEVGRSAKWQNKDKSNFNGAVLRALELFDLTLDDKRWTGRLREIARLREYFCDALNENKEYSSNLLDLEKYFFNFMFLARKDM